MRQTQDPVRMPAKPISRVALLGFLLALIGAVTAMMAGLGSRWDGWHFRTGFLLLKWGAYGAIVASVVSLIGAVIARPGGSRRGFTLAILGFVIGLVVVGVPWQLLRTARQVPAIHDITTDTENPPSFVAILPLRKEASNPAEYGGPDVAADQREAYPDLVPLILPLPPDQAFVRALQAVKWMDWELVEANPAEGRIEATDTTFWFGFKDDVVIRITPSEGGSRIDLRSVSREGRSDVGTNARRIRAFLDAVKKSL